MWVLGATDPYPGQDPRAFSGYISSFFSFWPAYIAGDVDIHGNVTAQGKAKLVANLAAENPTVPVSQIEADTTAATEQYGVDPSQHVPTDPISLLTGVVMLAAVVLGGAFVLGKAIE
jgi:hypothetical protein